MFESPRRVRATLLDVLDVLGDRRAAVVRELTKLHEEVLRGTVSELAERLRDRELKGEVVVVIGGAPEGQEPDVKALVEEARGLVAAGLKPRAAAAEVARRHGVSANRVYAALVERPR